MRDDLHHQPDAGHVDHLPALLFDLGNALTRFHRKIGEFKQRLLQFLERLSALGGRDTPQFPYIA